MKMHEADYLREELAPRLPDFEVTAVPWADDEGEWIVTVWDEGEALLDVFENYGTYTLRRVGAGAVLGKTKSLARLPKLVRGAIRRFNL